MYINCHSHFSLRYGIIAEQEILDIAIADQVSSVALTDINNTSACLNFIRLAQRVGIRPIVGVDCRDGARQLYVILAQSNEGFYHLNRFLSEHLHQDLPFPAEAPLLPETFVIYPFERVLLLDKHAFASQEYIGINRREVYKLSFSKFSQYRDRLIALNSFTFRDKRDYNLHRLLRAIEHNILLSKLPIEEQAPIEDQYISSASLSHYYAQYPHIVANTHALMAQCEICFDFTKNKKHQNKKSYTGDAVKDEKLLYNLCQKGLAYRYTTVTAEIKRRIEKELSLIKKMDFIPFFLINWDIINYAKRCGYYHVGRGSGANSIVAYLLGITDVDPIALDLYFERFMNLYRSSPPDFDIDFSWRDRDDVIRYIFERFGARGQVALLATYNTFQHRAAVRELGKVFGLPKHEIDKLCRRRIDTKGLDKISQLVLIYARRLEGLPNYRSIHAGGILIAEKPIHYFTATDLPPKGYPTTQFDMLVAEDVGLNKYDILAQRGLGKIKDALQLIRQNHPTAPKIDIHQAETFLQDPWINAKISRGACIGCFYVESPAMRMLLQKLAVDNYPGLVAASSIIRPGVAQSGMMREYIMRHKDPARRQLAHPVLVKIMPDTYGVMVYQEDVIKVAHHFAGLTLGEADVLRRGMSGKYRSREEFLKVKEKFVHNCRQKGYAEQVIIEVWRQIESFAGYAFAKGHSASYAVESYQSLYLKTYYPLEYMVAVLNNGGGYYSAELYINEARQHGGKIHAPCVNRSYYLTTIYGEDIYLGFGFLQGLTQRTVQRIVRSRQKHGHFHSIEDFLNRVTIGIEQMDILVRINAFRFLQEDKRSLLWKAHYIIAAQAGRRTAPTLFTQDMKKFELPQFSTHPLEDAFDQIDLMGFTLTSPFRLLANPLPQLRVKARDFPNYKNRKVLVCGYLVSIKNTKTSRGERMQFGTFLDEWGHWVDTVHFPPVVRAFPFRGKGVYQLLGKVVDEFGYYSLEVERMYRLAYIEDPRFVISQSV